MSMKRYWLLALLIASIIHAAGFAYYVYESEPEDEGAKDAGLQGVQINLGMLGDLGTQEQTKEPAAEPEPVKKPEPLPEPIEKEKPVAEVKAVKKQKVPPKQDSIIKVKKQVKPAPAETAEVVEKPIKEMKTEAPKTDTTSSDSVVNNSKNQQASQKATTGAANSQMTGGQLAAQQTYFSQLAAILAQHKRYPKASRRRGEEGIVKLFFIVDRTGKVTDYRITRSSGSSRLDNAVINMLKNAQPLPAFPSDMEQQQLEVKVPIAFKLNMS